MGLGQGAIGVALGRGRGDAGSIAAGMLFPGMGSIGRRIQSSGGAAINYLFGQEPAPYALDSGGKVRDRRGRFVSRTLIEQAGFELFDNEFRKPDRVGFLGATRTGRGLRVLDEPFARMRTHYRGIRDDKRTADLVLDHFETDPVYRQRLVRKYNRNLGDRASARHMRGYRKRLSGILEGMDPSDLEMLDLADDALLNKGGRNFFGRRSGIDLDDDVAGGSLYRAISMRSKMAGTAMLGTATFLPRQMRATMLGLGFSTLFGGAVGLMGVGAGLAVGGSALTFGRYAKGRTTADGAEIPGHAEGAEALQSLVSGFHMLVDTIATGVGPALQGLVESIGSAMTGISIAVDWIYQARGFGRNIVGNQAASIATGIAPVVGTAAGLWAGAKLGGTLGAAIGSGAGPAGLVIGGLAGALVGTVGGAVAGDWIFGEDSEEGVPYGLGRFIQGGAVVAPVLGRSPDAKINPLNKKNYLGEAFLSLLEAEPDLLEGLDFLYDSSVSSSYYSRRPVPAGKKKRKTDRFGQIQYNTIDGYSKDRAGIISIVDTTRFGNIQELKTRLNELNQGDPYSAQELDYLYQMAAEYKASLATPFVNIETQSRLYDQALSKIRIREYLGALGQDYPEYADRITLDMVKGGYYGGEIDRIGFGYDLDQVKNLTKRNVGVWGAQASSQRIENYQQQQFGLRQGYLGEIEAIESRRVAIGRELNLIMQQETQLRYTTIQHRAEEALDAPRELHDLNFAIHELRDFRGVYPLPYGTTGKEGNLAAHEQWLEVLGGFSGLEDTTLSSHSTSVHARGSNQSLPNYIRSFITETTGFDVPRGGIQAIMQQFGASEAGEASEDLTLRMQANSLQLRSNELTEENNKLLESLKLIMYYFLAEAGGSMAMLPYDVRTMFDSENSESGGVSAQRSWAEIMFPKELEGLFG